MRLFSRDGDHRDGDFARKASEIKTFAQAYESRNVYVAPNPSISTGGIRHSTSDVSHWSYFFIDVDPIHPKANDPLRSLWRALDFLGAWTDHDFRKTPPIIIDSGRGVQAWLRLNDLELVDNFTKDSPNTCVLRKTVRRVQGYWLKKLEEYVGPMSGCRIDTTVCDLPRVMRCPGTINQKTGKKAKFLVPSAAVYNLLALRLLDDVPDEVFAEPKAVTTPAEGTRWQEVFPHLTVMAQTYLTQGCAEGNRHKILWHTARKLCEVGLAREETYKALRRANRLRGEEEELDRKDILNAIETAYGS